MEDDLQKKWKTNKSTKINLIGCNTIVNSPSFIQCFHILGDALTEVAKEVHSGQLPSKSQRTSLMMFSSKPGKSSHTPSPLSSYQQEMIGELLLEYALPEMQFMLQARLSWGVGLLTMTLRLPSTFSAWTRSDLYSRKKG